MVRFEVRFDDGEVFANVDTQQKAEEIRSKYNFQYISRSLHIWMITTYGGWNETKIV